MGFGGFPKISGGLGFRVQGLLLYLEILRVDRGYMVIILGQHPNFGESHGKEYGK